MRITQLTVLGLVLNGAIDSGKYRNVSTEDVLTELERGTIFEYLQRILGRNVFGDFSPQDKQEIREHWEALANVADSKRKFLVENNGLNLLLAYVLEGIQNGTSRDGRLPTQRQ